jgi:uncharacterized protein YbjQ (UPF0145 family)
MLTATTETIAGKEITDTLGTVRGNTVRARNVGRDILSGLKNLVGGEIGNYTELMTEAREEAMARMIQQAEEMGADAVVGVRMSTADVLQGTAEIMVYGTAVKLK